MGLSLLYESVEVDKDLFVIIDLESIILFVIKIESLINIFFSIAGLFWSIFSSSFAIGRYQSSIFGITISNQALIIGRYQKIRLRTSPSIISV